MKTALLTALLFLTLLASSQATVLFPRAVDSNHYTSLGFSVVTTVMTATTGGNRLANGDRNDANSAYFVALPSRNVLGREVWVFVPETERLARHIPVRDVGPWSVRDAYWERDGIPLAASGRSDMGVCPVCEHAYLRVDGRLKSHGRCPGSGRAVAQRRVLNAAGIDLSRYLCKALDLPYPYKGQAFWGFEPERKVARGDLVCDRDG
jgi:hypothetical protein